MSKKKSRRRRARAPDLRQEPKGSKAKGLQLFVSWLVFFILFGGTAAFFIHDWCTRRHAHISLAWLAFLLIWLALEINATVRWVRFLRSEHKKE